MPMWPFKKPSDPTRKALRRIEEARKNGAQDLRLSDLKLRTLPEAICQLTQLQWLDLSGNLLSTLPEAICQLTQLPLLDLSGNLLSTLPEAISQLTNRLRTLNLSDNQLSTPLPEAI